MFSGRRLWFFRPRTPHRPHPVTYVTFAVPIWRYGRVLEDPLLPPNIWIIKRAPRAELFMRHFSNEKCRSGNMGMSFRKQMEKGLSCIRDVQQKNYFKLQYSRILRNSFISRALKSKDRSMSRCNSRILPAAKRDSPAHNNLLTISITSFLEK